MMVKETAPTFRQYLSKAGQDVSKEHWEKMFHSLVLQRKLQAEVRWITESKKDGVMQPINYCLKTGKPVLGVICSKHPESRAPSTTILDAYPV